MRAVNRATAANVIASAGVSEAARQAFFLNDCQNTFNTVLQQELSTHSEKKNQNNNKKKYHLCESVMNFS